MEFTKQGAVKHSTEAFFAMVTHPLKLKLYLLKNLPSAYFSGLKVVKANHRECQVRVPYQWFTRNPFRSTYFACLSMAAELSTGVLAMSNIYGRRPAVSMLIKGIESKFYKKAKGFTLFQCLEGDVIAKAVDAAIIAGTGQEIKVYTQGINNAGEVVAEFWFTWSFKVR